jgi:hypothetical protein
MVIAVILYAWGIFAALYGIMTLGVATTSIHEIQAGVAFLIATIAIGLAGVITSVHRKMEPESKPIGAPLTQDW